MSQRFTDQSPQERIALAIIIERIVRPLRATSSYKRKVREELLAHLISISNQEKSTTSDSSAALAQTARRFGDPVQLSRDLAASIPTADRIGYWIERYFAWRFPESAARYSLRLSIRIFLLAAVVSLVLPLIFYVAQLLPHGPLLDLRALALNRSLLIALRIPATVLCLFPITLFLLFFFYYKIRNAIFGVFGSPRSLDRAAIFSLLSGLVVFATCIIFVAVTRWNLHSASEIVPAATGASIYTIIVHPLLAWGRGRAEIDHTFWSSLDIA